MMDQGRFVYWGCPSGISASSQIEQYKNNVGPTWFHG
jgi:hypothetical protein